MSEFRQSLDELFAECDAHDAESEAWEARQAQREIKTRDAGNIGLVYKRYDNPPLQQPQIAATMDDATQKLWDRWCDRRIKRTIEGPLKEALAIALAKTRQSMRAEFTAELDALREEIEKAKQ